MHTLTMLRQHHARCAVLSDGSKVLPMGRGVVDIFTGEGWLQQSRYRFMNNRYVYMSGNRLDNEWFKKNLTNRLH